jgi:inosine-uridine nucleoside N-ribohydrolase
MVAVMVAVASPQLELVGVTTVAGNQTGAKTYHNALKTLTLIGETGIPVARGADKPLFRDLTVAPEIHGVSGLDGADLPAPGFEGVEQHAVDFLIQTIMESSRPLILVPTGPLTNVALAMLKDPRITTKLERIVLMGGAVFDSNITPAAEFNIYVDPEAAKVVFGSGVPLTMVGLDVTNKALFGFDDIERLAAMKGKVSRIVAPLLRFFAQANKDIFGFDGAPLHDALAVAHLIAPEVIKTRELNVEIETDGELTRGRTVADVYGVTGKTVNTKVALEVDNDLFKEILIQAFKILDSR